MPLLMLYCRSVTALNRALALSVSVLVFVMVVVISYEVVARYFFNAPTVWALELATLLFGPYFILAGPYILHRGGHVNVDILYGKLPRRWAGVADCATYVIIVVLSVIVIRESWPLAVNAWNSGETSFSAWNPPTWWIKALIPVGFGLLLLQSLAELVDAVARAAGGRQTPDEAAP